MIYSFVTVPITPASVVVGSSPLVSIAVTPSTATLPVGLSSGFRATGNFQTGPPQDLTTSVNWASNNPSVATISNTVTKQGVATGVASGTADISAVFAGFTGSASVDVSTATLTSITVQPSSSTVPVGSSQQLSAIGNFTGNITVDLTTQATWTSSNAAVAIVTSYGSVNGISTGTAVITATFVQNGTTVTGSANINVP